MAKKEHVAAMFEGAEAIAALMAQPNLDCIDVSGADLAGLKLKGAYLESCNFTGANLSGAKLSDCEMPGVVMNGANLEGASLCRCYMVAGEMRGANLSGCYLEGADLGAVNLRNAYLRGAILWAENGERGTCFQGADLRGVQGLGDALGLEYAQWGGAALNPWDQERILGALRGSMLQTLAERSSERSD